jgi:hypothetical protein
VVFAAGSLASRPAHAAETFLDFEMQAGGFYGIAGPAHAGGFVPGLTAGGLTWFGDDPVAGLRYVANVDVGLLVAPAGVKGTSMFSGSIGPAFLLSGDAKHPGGVISIGWAPRMMLDFAQPTKNLAGSLAGVELEMGWAALKFPIWYLHTLGSNGAPAGDFVGFGIGLDLARLLR